LAIAVIIGGKLNDLVTSVVNDLLLPVFFQPALQAAGVNDIRELAVNGIHYGRAIGALIDFLIIAFIVFLFAASSGLGVRPFFLISFTSQVISLISRR
jgi:large conductance mechanosensitive channel